MTPYRVESYGVCGRKRRPWRRVFSSVETMRKWADAHGAVVFGTRAVTRDEWLAERGQ